jgi:hypothetical protein
MWEGMPFLNMSSNKPQLTEGVIGVHSRTRNHLCFVHSYNFAESHLSAFPMEAGALEGSLQPIVGLICRFCFGIKCFFQKA